MLAILAEMEGPAQTTSLLITAPVRVALMERIVKSVSARESDDEILCIPFLHS